MTNKYLWPWTRDLVNWTRDLVNSTGDLVNSTGDLVNSVSLCLEALSTSTLIASRLVILPCNQSTTRQITTATCLFTRLIIIITPLRLQRPIIIFMPFISSMTCIIIVRFWSRDYTEVCNWTGDFIPGPPIGRCKMRCIMFKT